MFVLFSVFLGFRFVGFRVLGFQGLSVLRLRLFGV